MANVGDVGLCRGHLVSSDFWMTWSWTRLPCLSWTPPWSTWPWLMPTNLLAWAVWDTLPATSPSLSWAPAAQSAPRLWVDWKLEKPEIGKEKKGFRIFQGFWNSCSLSTSSFLTDVNLDIFSMGFSCYQTVCVFVCDIIIYVLYTEVGWLCDGGGPSSTWYSSRLIYYVVILVKWNKTSNLWDWPLDVSCGTMWIGAEVVATHLRKRPVS